MDVCAPGDDETRAMELLGIGAELAAVDGEEGVAAGGGADGAVELRGAEPVEEAAVHGAVAEHAHGAGIGVRQDGFGAVLLCDGGEPLCDGVERLVPGDALKAFGLATTRQRAFRDARSAAHGVKQAIGRIDAIEILGDFAAEKSAGDRMIRVAGDFLRAAVGVHAHQHGAGVRAVVGADCVDHTQWRFASRHSMIVCSRMTVRHGKSLVCDGRWIAVRKVLATRGVCDDLKKAVTTSGEPQSGDLQDCNWDGVRRDGVRRDASACAEFPTEFAVERRRECPGECRASTASGTGDTGAGGASGNSANAPATASSPTTTASLNAPSPQQSLMNPSSAQNPYYGSVTMGTVSPETLHLSLDDAIQRGIQANLALTQARIQQQESDAQRLLALNPLLPSLKAEASTGAHQYNLETFGFNPSLLAKIAPLFPDTNFARLQSDREGRCDDGGCCAELDDIRSCGDHALPVGEGELEGGVLQHAIVARAGGAECGQSISEDAGRPFAD